MNKEKEAVQETGKEKSIGRSKALTIVGIVLCVILVPILIVNVTMIVKSYIKPDEYPSFAGYNLMIILSPSMEDTIKTGDLIVVKNAEPKDVKGESAEGAQDGTIISFFDPDSSKHSVLTHRCVKVNDDGTFLTKGDANASVDPTPCPSENLIGTYITRIPGAGSVAMWLQTTPGLIVCVAVPIVLLIAYDLIMKKRYDKSKKKDTDALLAELDTLRAQQAAKEEQAEAKAESSDEKAVNAAAQKKADQPEQKPKAEKSAEKEDPAETKDAKDPAPAEEKKAEAPAQEAVSADTMTAEELEEFREFQRLKAQKKAEQEAAEPKEEK